MRSALAILILCLFFAPVEAKTLASRNNNPCNVRGKGWVGQIGTDKYGYAVFKHSDFAYRATARVLRTYQSKHGIKTLRKIVARYCGGSHKKPLDEAGRHYLAYLSKSLHIRPDSRIDVDRHMPKLLHYMAIWESGTKSNPKHLEKF